MSDSLACFLSRALADRKIRFELTVLVAGLVAVGLNLIIPRELLQDAEEEEEVEQVVQDVEAPDQVQKP